MLGLVVESGAGLYNVEQIHSMSEKCRVPEGKQVIIRHLKAGKDQIVRQWTQTPLALDFAMYCKTQSFGLP